MNSRRLSTLKLPTVDTACLDADILGLLSKPSNYDKREDGVWIRSENKFLICGVVIAVQLLDQNGSILHSFDSITDCAKFLEKPRQTVSKWAQDSRTFLFKDNPVSLKKV